MTKKDNLQISKIDFDEETKEPKIVTVKKSEIKNPIEKKRPADPFIVTKKGQVTIHDVLGFKTDKSIDKRKRILKNLVTILFLVFVIGVLVYTAFNDFSKNDLASWGDIKGIVFTNWYYIFGVILSIVIFFLAKGLLRTGICHSITGKIKLKACINSGIVCQFYNNVTPLAMGGQPFEVSYFCKNGLSGGHASSVAITTYLVNSTAYALLYLVAIVLYQSNLLQFAPNKSGLIVFDYFPDYIFLFAILGTVLNLITPFLVLIFSIFPKLGSLLVHFVIWIGAKLKIVKNQKVLTYKTLRSVLINAKSIKKLFKKPLLMFSSFIFSFLEALAYCSIAYFTLKLFGFDWESWSIWEWTQIVTLVLLINSAVSFIPTPGSSGAADFSFYELFSKELLGGLGFTAMLTWRIFSYYLLVVLGFFFIKILSKKTTKTTFDET